MLPFRKTSGVRKQKGESDAAAPGLCQGFFDHAQPLIGMDEAARRGQDADMRGQARATTRQDRNHFLVRHVLFNGAAAATLKVPARALAQA